MIVRISREAELDLTSGYWFYENREPGLGAKFRESIKIDIRSLEVHGGVHSIRFGFHRMLCKKFPFSIYYSLGGRDVVTVVAIFSQKRGRGWIEKRLGGDAG